MERRRRTGTESAKDTLVERAGRSVMHWASDLLDLDHEAAVDSRSEFERSVQEGSETCLVVAQFTAPWCKACDAMASNMASIRRTHGDVRFIKVDASLTGPGLCRDLGVKKLPWFQIYHTPAEPAAEPALVVNVHANKRNQKLLSRQLEQLKRKLT